MSTQFVKFLLRVEENLNKFDSIFLFAAKKKVPAVSIKARELHSILKKDLRAWVDFSKRYQRKSISDNPSKNVKGTLIEACHFRSLKLS
jgi:hypothetical protein